MPDDWRPMDWRYYMQMIFSRIIPFLDVQTLAAGEAREILFRNPDDSFILYLADSTAASTTNERVIRLGMREALIWLNERPEDDGSFWI